ncbi:unannotated protein [freshwater metagenome]|uniref:Unannotated protein n=1 Tax=freshwater metagenome TaxID=449393 RepID=A0A6J7SZF8_9ZZZZ|nr:biotin transporter BioY [Actinomycetota bacterium]
MTSIAASTTLRASALPKGIAIDIALVSAFALLNAGAAQISIPLPFTPVPLTLQTFAVLLTGSVLGTGRGLASLALYVAIGSLGAPWFAGGSSGFGGVTFGYVLGFLLAGAIVGRLAERGATHSISRTILSFTAGTFAIYAVGVPWLMANTGMNISQALNAGLTPFLLGDLVKAAAAGVLLPGLWKLIQRKDS